MILAAKGWRIVLADRESGGAVYCPIVAWDHPRVPFGERLHYLDPFFVDPYGGASVVRLSASSYADVALGILAPSDAPELGAWDEQAAQTLEAGDA